MHVRPTRTRRWLAGIAALTCVLPVALAGSAFARPAASEPGGGEPGKQWVSVYEKHGDRWGSDIDFSGTDDGWIAGVEYEKSSAYGTPFFTHWDGETWSEVDPGELVDKRLQATSIAALAPDDVWAAGPSIRSGQSYGRGHWDGTSWTYSEGPDVEANQRVGAPTTKRIGAQVWVTGTIHVDGEYGLSKAQAFVDRLVDGEWQQMRLPDQLTTNAGAFDVYGTSPDDVYVIAATEANGKQTPRLAHWDGASWSVEELPTPNDWDQGWMAENVAVSNGTIYVWGRPSDDDERMFRSEDGKTWDRVDIPFLGITDVDVHPRTGDLLVSEVPTPFTSETATFDGKEWTTYPQPDVIDNPSTAFSAAYVPGTDQMVASVLLANSQEQPNRAKQYITTNQTE